MHCAVFICLQQASHPVSVFDTSEFLVRLAPSKYTQGKGVCVGGSSGGGGGGSGGGGD